MPIFSKKHGGAIELAVFELNNENPLNKLKEITNFFQQVKGSTFFGLINEPARIRAKINKDKNLIIEARTGSIFAIIYKKLTEKSARAVQERVLAKNHILNIIAPYDKEENPDCMRYIKKIKLLLEDTNKEFSRIGLYENLNSLHLKLKEINSSSIEKESQAKSENQEQLALQQKKSEKSACISANLNSNANFEYTSNTINSNESSPSPSQIDQSKFESSKFSGLFINRENFHISEFKRIIQIEADLYVVPQRPSTKYGIIDFTNQDINEEIKTKSSVVKCMQAKQTSAHASRSYTLSTIEPLQLTEGQNKTEFIKELVSRYLTCFKLLAINSETKHIAIQPVTFHSDIITRYESRALLIALNEFKKAHPTLKFLIIASMPVKKSLTSLFKTIPDMIKNFQ